MYGGNTKPGLREQMHVLLASSQKSCRHFVALEGRRPCVHRETGARRARPDGQTDERRARCQTREIAGSADRSALCIEFGWRADYVPSYQ